MDPRKSAKILGYNLPEHRKNIAHYMWTIFTESTQLTTQDLKEFPFIIDRDGPFPISKSFDDILHGSVNNIVDRYRLPEGLDEFRNEEPIACAFYLMNSLHESLLPEYKWDKYQRYPYQESIQYANDLMEVNYVQEIFDHQYQKICGKSPPRMNSRIMWSHDIDYLYSAWKSDLITAYRTRQITRIPSLLYKALTRPHRWNNIEQILQLEKQVGIHSLFFWITEHGKAATTNDHYIDHADYSFQNKNVRRLWNKIVQAGSENGLHKSAFNSSFRDEMNKLPDQVTINRNHFLKLNVTKHYKALESSGLRYDASLGFPEHHGFRNSFGRPFHPYNIPKNRPYSFIEIPLHLMDTTFLTYYGWDKCQMMTRMKEFINQHKYACTLSILLHNSHFDFHDTAEVEHWHQFFYSQRSMHSVLPTQIGSESRPFN